MIKADVYIDKYRWLVHCYFAVDCYYTDEIVSRLRDMGCGIRYAEKAYDNMSSCSLDSGLCYSDTGKNESVMVTSIASSPAQFLNSFVHEIAHLADHISMRYGIKPGGEDYCALCGDISELMFPQLVAGIMETGL